jgi:preprotein translocase subunit SecE
MNREMRRLMEREERRNKKQDGSGKDRQRRLPGSGQTGERKPVWRRLAGFLHDVRQELKKVSWPTQEQMIAFTTVTLITTVVLTIVTFGLDVVMKEAVLFFVERT